MQRISTVISLLLSLVLLAVLAGCGGSGDQQNASEQDKEQLEQFVDGHNGGGHGGMNEDTGENMPRDAIHGYDAPRDSIIAVGPLAGSLPEGWLPVPPVSSMRQAQYRLDPVDGDPNGAEVSVFYFGENAGTVEMNIDRWRNQFKHEDGSPLSEADVTRETFSSHGMDITMVSFNGTQKPINMRGAPSTPELDGWMNVSAIVMTPQGPWFFKGTGPEATMKHHYDGFKKMLKSLEFATMNAHG